MKKYWNISVAVFVTTILLQVLPAIAAEEKIHTTSDTLLARIQVEDFINDYYWELATIGEGDLSLFWAEDAVFDVNGAVYEGLKAINDVYSLGLGPGGRLVFQTNIPRIKIDGEKAVVDLIYTGFLNTDSAEAPKPYEQGHDHMELRDAGSGWEISSRTLRTFSLDQSYAE